MIITKKIENPQKYIEEAIGFKCSICKKEYKHLNYIDVETGHNSWGNDSIDSIEDYHVCSIKCLFDGIKNNIFQSIDYESVFMNIELNKFHLDKIKEMN